MGRLFLGTSGYSYRHWRGVFYPKDLPAYRWLEFYCEHFSTVELNVTFYRLPERKTFKSWYKRTPPDFTFAVKGSRFITHIKKLKDCSEPLNAFREAADSLGDKLGVILWQLPPSLHYDKDRLEEFCHLLSGSYPDKRHAFEFRHESWLNDECYTILRNHGQALCIPVAPGLSRVEECFPPFGYIRFHGGEIRRDSCYTDKELKAWAAKIANWLDRYELYIYFNNDAYGFAIANAKKLSEYLFALQK